MPLEDAMVFPSMLEDKFFIELFSFYLPVVLPSDLDLKDFLRCFQRLQIIGQPHYKVRLRSRSDFDNNRNRHRVLRTSNNPTYTCPITPVCQTILFLLYQKMIFDLLDSS